MNQPISLKYIESHRKQKNRHAAAYLARITGTLDKRYNTRIGHSWLRNFKGCPDSFARKVLGSVWWSKQKAIAMKLRDNRRVAVKSANGVGKTYLAADLALWFLYTHQPAIVLTAAPTWRQVRHLLWEEIRRRWATAPVKLPGQLRKTRIDAGEGWFAIGVSSDSAVRFQGFHAENLLVIFDEASGIPDDIWDAAEAIALGDNNKILAIGNPLVATGRFYQKFRDNSGWQTITISAFHHPNIHKKRKAIPGCITEEFLESCLYDWCDPLDPSPGGAAFVSQGWPEPLESRATGESHRSYPTYPTYESIADPAYIVPGKGPPPSYYTARAGPLNPDLAEGPRDRSFPAGTHARRRAGPEHPNTRTPEHRSRASPTINHQPSTINQSTTLHPQVQPDLIVWKGETYRPNNLFRARVLGEFPTADDESLIPLRHIEAAINRPIPAHGYTRMAADIARYGDNETVLGVRVGPVVTHLEARHGADTMEVAGMIAQLAYQWRPETIAVDSAGLGAGVVDRLVELNIAGVWPFNGGKKPFAEDRFVNRRAELYWGLRERFHKGEISIPNDRLLVEQLANLRYKITSMGLIQIESKDEMKRRGQSSPDRADMLTMLMDGCADYLFGQPTEPLPPSRAQILKEEMQGW